MKKEKFYIENSYIDFFVQYNSDNHNTGIATINEKDVAYNLYGQPRPFIGIIYGGLKATGGFRKPLKNKQYLIENESDLLNFVIQYLPVLIEYKTTGMSYLLQNKSPTTITVTKTIRNANYIINMSNGEGEKRFRKLQYPVNIDNTDGKLFEKLIKEAIKLIFLKDRQSIKDDPLCMECLGMGTKTFTIQDDGTNKNNRRFFREDAIHRSLQNKQSISLIQNKQSC